MIFSPARCARTGKKGKSVNYLKGKFEGKIPRELLCSKGDFGRENPRKE